jgi:hypothetical protein
MNDDRWVLLGLGHPRARWFSDIAKWSTTGAIPVDFVKCVSADEASVRLGSGRPFSAMLVGGDAGGVDRDLIHAAHDVGTIVIVVDPQAERDWTDLGVCAVLRNGVDRPSLVSTLRTHAAPVARVGSSPVSVTHELEATPVGHLVAVTGPGGAGSSITAMALAQAFASEAANADDVLLADLCLDADLGVLHDSREVLPGVQELADAHRSGRLSVEQVRSLSFDVADRGYRLLLGLRRHRDWTAIRRRAFASALEGLLYGHGVVIADVGCDIEGEDATGSIDVEDRNTLARTTLLRADIVAVVGNPTTKGVHALTRAIRELHFGGVAAERMIPVFARAPRSPRRRAEAVRALDALLGADDALAAVGNPAFLTDRNDIEESIRDGRRLPAQLGRRLHDEVRHRLESPTEHAPASAGLAGLPELVTPGSLGAWTEETA